MSRTLSLEKEELKALMKEVLEEFFDPDYGLEIRPEIMKLLAFTPTNLPFGVREALDGNLSMGRSGRGMCLSYAFEHSEGPEKDPGLRGKD